MDPDGIGNEMPGYMDPEIPGYMDPDGIEKDIYIDITEKEGFWDPTPGDLHYLVVSDPSGPDREIVPGYEYEPIKLFKVKSLENKIKRKLC